MKRSLPLISLFSILSLSVIGQEVWFFSEGTSQSFYDQGIVDVANLGTSIFEHTYPPGLPQYNDKVPCTSTAFKGSSSLKFNYTSSSDGNWKVNIFRNDWSSASVTGMDSISLYVYSASGVPSSALPMIGLRAMNTSGTGEVSSVLYRLSDFNGDLPSGEWVRLRLPLNIITEDAGNSTLNFSAVKAVIFSQSEANNTSRIIFIDEITAFKHLEVIPAVSGLSAIGYDSHAELSWIPPVENLTYRIYASFNGGSSYELRGETTDSSYLDFVPVDARNTSVKFRVISFALERESAPSDATAVIRDFSDDELLDMVEWYTFRYFWEGAHQISGMALERSNGSSTTVASGGTGMGLMAMIAAHERVYLPSEEIKDRIILILSFLESCDRYHGAWSHWYNGDTGLTQPFSDDDDGGDLVETSYVAQALISLKNYFTGEDTKSVLIREKADLLWKGIDWTWYRQYGQNVLYWHWSPDNNFKINMKIRGWNECLVTYILAASSPTFGIPKEVYTQGWAGSGSIINERTYYEKEISLSPDWGGPLFWLHYSHLGINPHGLKDQYADYWIEHVNTVKIHHAYAEANPSGWENYTYKCWGLTASDDPFGYSAHQPMTNDNGTISPTAALSSIPYAPEEGIIALKYFYRERGKDLFGKYGFYDAFNDDMNWVGKAWLSIDQGPIAVMIENYRSALLWNCFMKDSDVVSGLDKLGFQYKTADIKTVNPVTEEILIFPNPSSEVVKIIIQDLKQPVMMRIYGIDGRLIREDVLNNTSAEFSLDVSGLLNGFYIVSLFDGKKLREARLLINR